MMMMTISMKTNRNTNEALLPQLHPAALPVVSEPSAAAVAMFVLERTACEADSRPHSEI